MYFLDSAGSRGGPIADLTWGLLAMSASVVGLIAVLVLAGVLVRRSRTGSAPGDRIPISRGPGGLPWIYGGLLATTVVLAAFVVWTMSTLVSISTPEREPTVTIEIVGHQWWWEVRYISDDPSRIFETANEIHVPVGEPVRLKLSSADVIHSFWVPAISGKTDLIPGRVNETWIEAERVGVYRGQCAEYCGRQHAHMAMRLFADAPEDFRKWWNAQLQPADPPETASARRGQDQFLLQCGVCHTVRGTPAGGQMGPDLTHLMARTTIAANTLPNTEGHLSAWVADPQGIKPEARMPTLDLSGPQLTALRHYLTTLE